MERGYLQVYTGNGKGKTTAALGLAVRAAGAGLAVYLGQFIKSMEYHEIAVLRKIPGITVELYGSKGCIVDREPDSIDQEGVDYGMEKAAQALTSGQYDLVILDEIFIACFFEMLTGTQIVELADGRAPGTELVLTGRYAPQEVLEHADLVTEMKDIRHYYDTLGLLARDGIER